MNRNADIVNELKELSPVLARLKEQEVLPKLPEIYFTSLADEILNEVRLTSALPKTPPQVPAGYFDTFYNEVMTKIKAEEVPISAGSIESQGIQKKRIIRLFQRIAVAACIFGAVFLVKKVQHTSFLSANNCTDGLACLTQNEIYNYMNTNSHEFDLQEVQQAVQPVLEKQEGVQKITVSDKEIEQYVKQHNNIIETEDPFIEIF